jgi:hypothetical protein
LALYYNRLAFADLVLEQDFRIHHTPTYRCLIWNWWIWTDPPRNLDDLKAFIDRHPEKAADFAPTSADFQEIVDLAPQQVLDLIYLVHHCATVSHRVFNANIFFTDFIKSRRFGITKNELAGIANALLHCGMKPGQVILDELVRIRPHDDLTYETITNFPLEEVKYPGFE